MSSPQAPNPIDGVISELKQLIGWRLDQPTRIGYFGSLYLRVTNTIRSKIGTGYFDDDARMELLDAASASRSSETNSARKSVLEQLLPKYRTVWREWVCS